MKLSKLEEFIRILKTKIPAEDYEITLDIQDEELNIYTQEETKLLGWIDLGTEVRAAQMTLATPIIPRFYV